MTPTPPQSDTGTPTHQRERELLAERAQLIERLRGVDEELQTLRRHDVTLTS